MMTLTVAKNVNILGVDLDECLLMANVPVYVNHEEVHAILGMDYIKKVGGFTLRFNETGNPIVAFNQPPQAETARRIANPTLLTLNQPPVPLRTIEREDFTLQQFVRQDPEHPEWKYKWVVSWKWIDGPRGKFGCPVYFKTGMPQEHRDLLDAEIQKWIDNEFLVPIKDCEKHLMRGTVPIKPEEQLHKTSTPVRPVCDFRWLNEYIKSVPNEGLSEPVAAPTYIRRWRSYPQAKMRLVDISKAYMRIYMNEEQSYYQCVRYPDKFSTFRLTRLGFGISIAPKVLRTLLETILPPETFPTMDTYVDDNFLPMEDVDSLRAALRENGLECKDPERVSEARVLGLQNHKDGTWSRRTELPRLEHETKRGVHKWTGRLVSHLPIAGWLRPACSALKRLCSGIDWDDRLDERTKKSCKKLEKMLVDRGDPAKGAWSYDKTKEWILYTDASLTAYGAVLMIGDTYVEDRTWLRKPGDKRHINVAELIGVYRGLSLIADYRSALKIEYPAVIQLKCDNKSAVAWLSRAEQRHWVAVKGLSAKVIEKTLHDIADTCKALQIELKVELIPSEANKSDPLSRVPEFLRDPKEEFNPMQLQEVICTTVPGNTQPLERDAYGRVIVSDRKLREIMEEVHEHEGAQSLYDRIRTVVSHKELRRRCQDYVRNCAVCSMSKVTSHTPIITSDTHMEEPTGPFSYVHLDIAGPYGEADGLDQLFIISLMDRETRFVLAKPTMLPPTGADAAALLRQTFDRFHVCVDVVHTDSGTQLTGAEFSRAIAELQARHVRTPVHSSWANGRVERWHRIVNERLRASMGGDEPRSYTTFAFTVRRAVLLHNTAKSSRTALSPHEQIFSFDPWIHPNLKYLRPEFETKTEEPREQPPPHPLGDIVLPKVDEIWLYRTQNKRKLDRPYVPCRILGNQSTQVYRIRLKKNRHPKTVHLRYLKPLTEEAVAQLAKGDSIPLDERPLRTRGGGGGHVAGAQLG
jgi:transposase InsO family protein